MKTEYDRLASNYADFRSVTDWELGYKNVVKLLGSLKNKTILDFGCGEGRVARFVCDMEAKVVAMDPSKEMIKLAMSVDANNIEFHCSNNVKFLKPNSVDVCMLNFVLCCLSDKSDIVEILSDINRVLKPNSPLIILSNHPKAVGKEFVSFKILEKENLCSGKEIRVILKSDKPFEVIDYYWTIDDYKEVLGKSSFHIQEIVEPIASGSGWINETKFPPYIIIKALKKNILNCI